MSKKYCKTYSTDRVMMDVWRSLARDFSGTQPIALQHQKFVLEGDVRGFRSCDFPDYTTTTPYRFKQWAQLEHFWKRYIFESEGSSAEVMVEEVESKFIATQMRLASLPEWNPGVKYLLRNARKIARSILGEYDPSEHFDACRFSQNAVVGTPSARAYMDIKLSKTMSGSIGHIEWFRRHYLPQDHMLQVVLEECQPEGEPIYTECTSLQLTTVPKSWKALRTITPNTLLGSFHSSGLGKMIEKRLRLIGLDIRRLQNRHGKLARQFSLNRSHATADLSAASDSITWRLVQEILPRAWYNQLNLGRLKHVTLPSGKTVYMETFMSMGIGFTFPLETLLFYCLLEALRRLRRKKGFISVYGDDLIYPRTLHQDVARLFPKLGFILNLDKTFVNTHFRESCGSDYYRGVDVRPYMPEGVGERLKKRPFEAFLYKLVNGLRRRWEDCEISSTLVYLYRRIANVSGRILQVPPDFPDFSGVKVTEIRQEWHEPWVAPSIDRVNLSYIFEHLQLMPDKRIIATLYPYHWDWFRKKLKCDDDDWLPDPYDAEVPSVCWIKTQPAEYTRSKITGARLRRLRAAIDNRSRIRFVNTKGSTISWI